VKEKVAKIIRYLRKDSLIEDAIAPISAPMFIVFATRRSKWKSNFHRIPLFYKRGQTAACNKT
jgi:hypothetical protein